MTDLLLAHDSAQPKVPILLPYPDFADASYRNVPFELEVRTLLSSFPVRCGFGLHSFSK